VASVGGDVMIVSDILTLGEYAQGILAHDAGQRVITNINNIYETPDGEGDVFIDMSAGIVSHRGNVASAETLWTKTGGTLIWDVGFSAGTQTGSADYYTLRNIDGVKLDQTTPQTFTNLGGGTGLMRVTEGLLGLDTSTYLTSSDLSGYALLDGTNQPFTGRVDVSYGGLSLNIGADSLASNRTDATIKYRRITGAHYTNAEEPVGIMMSNSGASSTILNFGGGSSYANAATQLAFYTAANNTTTTGTERMRIDSVGRIGINTAANAAALLEIKNTTTTYANLQITSDGTYPSFINSSASNTAFHGTYFNSYRSRGTQASKTATATDDTIFAYEMFGYDGNSNVKGAQFKCLVDNTVSDEVVPMRFLWGTMNSAGTLAERMRLTAEGYLGIGTTAPSAKLHSLSTTEQLRLGYDASNYLSATIGSTGNATLALTGTTPIFTFSQAIKGAGGFQSSDGTAGLTATKVFNDGAVVNTVTIKDGLITAWTQI
jgi:hypothetical protein